MRIYVKLSPTDTSTAERQVEKFNTLQQMVSSTLIARAVETFWVDKKALEVSLDHSEVVDLQKVLENL